MYVDCLSNGPLPRLRDSVAVAFGRERGRARAKQKLERERNTETNSLFRHPLSLSLYLSLLSRVQREFRIDAKQVLRPIFV